MTALEEYFVGIADGKIVACEKMKLAADMILERYYSPDEYHFDEEIANRHIGFIEKFCKLPAGRVGDPFKLELFQRARLQAIFGFVDDNNLRQYNEVLIIEGRKNGKALSLDTDIPTSSGWKKMRDIAVGDEVFGSDGKPHPVTCVSKIFKNHDCFKVTFEDGEEIVCDADHLWTVKKPDGSVKTLETRCLRYQRLKVPVARPGENCVMTWKNITSIFPVPSVDCKCIAIDSADHLYCAGRSYTLTHNTSETAAVELDMLVNDGEGSPEVYNVATMLDQAKLGFTAAYKMIQQSPMLKKHIRKRAADLYFQQNFGFIKALASNTNGLDGLNISCGVIDELAAIKNRDIYDLVKQAMGARKQPLLFTITTNGFVRESIFDAQYKYATDVLTGKVENKRFLPFIYELDNIDEWQDQNCWIKANPGLGTIKSLDYMKQMVEKAKVDLSFKPTVLVKDFNMKQTGDAAWLRWEELNNEEKIPEYAYRYGIGGMDAADSVDLSAAKLLFMKPDDPHIYVKSMYWLPRRALDEFYKLGIRQGRDAVPYDIWEAQGLIRLVDTHKVDKKEMLMWFKEIQEKEDIYILHIGYDPWHISDAELREFKYEFGEQSMIPIRQGVATLSQPMKDLKADLTAGLIVYDDNPIDKWCLANTAVRTDINGNIQPIKMLDSRKRIDGAMALIDGYIALKDNMDVYQTMI